jgi:hypothetical protein
MHRKIMRQSFQCKVLCQNSSEINGNHQNNMLTVATCIADVIMPVTAVVGCCAFVGLVTPYSPKLRLAYLKTEAH